MDGHTVLAAIRAARDALESAIGFSRGFANQSGLCEFPYNSNQLEMGDVAGFIADVEDQHRDWHEAYQAAVTSLCDADYPDADRWWTLDLTAAQVAYSEIPQLRVNGVRTRFTFVMGSGPRDVPITDNAAGSVSAGEVIAFDPDDADTIVAGAFDCSIVREWETVLEQIRAAEQRLYEQQLAWHARKPGRDIPDGPRADVANAVFWRGKQYPLTPQEWQICLAVWHADEGVGFVDLGDKVWGQEVPGGRIRTAVTRLNNHLAKHEIPVQFAVSAERVIRDGAASSAVTD
jgi:hypothetical protein